ncbi:hypothetical protein ACIA6T_15355 [Streptomyces sp. NPDC051740]
MIHPPGARLRASRQLGFVSMTTAERIRGQAQAARALLNQEAGAR